MSDHEVSDHLEMSEADNDGTRRVIVRGELDVATAHSVGDRLTTLLGQHRRIDLDLSGLSFIDSTGLGVLVQVTELAEQNGADLTIGAVSGNVLRVVKLTGLVERLNLRAPQD
jgi:anti-anti-sigma factor